MVEPGTRSRMNRLFRLASIASSIGRIDNAANEPPPKYKDVASSATSTSTVADDDSSSNKESSSLPSYRQFIEASSIQIWLEDFGSNSNLSAISTTPSSRSMRVHLVLRSGRDGQGWIWVSRRSNSNMLHNHLLSRKAQGEVSLRQMKWQGKISAFATALSVI